MKTLIALFGFLSLFASLVGTTYATNNTWSTSTWSTLSGCSALREANKVTLQWYLSTIRQNWLVLHTNFGWLRQFISTGSTWAVRALDIQVSEQIKLIQKEFASAYEINPATIPTTYVDRIVTKRTEFLNTVRSSYLNTTNFTAFDAYVSAYLSTLRINKVLRLSGIALRVDYKKACHWLTNPGQDNRQGTSLKRGITRAQERILNRIDKKVKLLEEKKDKLWAREARNLERFKERLQKIRAKLMPETTQTLDENDELDQDDSSQL